MPSVQRGAVLKRGSGWAARWYDENGTRQFKGGFGTKSEARSFVDSKVEEVVALRRGDPSALRRRELPTLGVLVDEYLAGHNAEANTRRNLKTGSATRPRGRAWTARVAGKTSPSTG
jgi:hypothetical protein